jgi:hypothetical protein
MTARVLLSLAALCLSMKNAVEDLHRRRHPNADFIASILTRKRL